MSIYEDYLLDTDLANDRYIDDMVNEIDSISYDMDHKIKDNAVYDAYPEPFKTMVYEAIENRERFMAEIADNMKRNYED